MATAEKKKYEIGDEIFTKCGKCKAEMYHIVTSLQDEEIKKVMCKGCNSEHTYRAKKATKKATTTAAKKAPTKRRRVGRRDWNKLMADTPEEAFVDYDMAADLSEIIAVRHKKFGDGVIVKVLTNKQVEVVFEDSTKVLVHNYQAA